MTLPTFYIAGGARCGSTSLEAYCRAHPQVYMSPIKEPNFFSYGCGGVPFAGPGYDEIYAAAVRDLDEYRLLFKTAGQARAVGEASINYMLHPEASAGINTLTPQARLLFILRQPVERAWSSFQRSCLQGREAEMDFLTAWRDDVRRREAGHWVSLHRYKSLYGKHLRPWFETFSREQIHVILFEEFQADTSSVMREVYEFIGVDGDFRPETWSVHNQTGEIANPVLRRVWRKSHRARVMLRPLLPRGWRGQSFRFLASDGQVSRKRKPIPADIKASLTEELRDDIATLEELLERDLSLWRD